jgi:maltose phosphorylase
MAGAWMNIVYGFGGMRSDGDRLAFSPAGLPPGWKRLSFRIRYAGSLLEVEVDGRGAGFRVVSGRPVALQIGGRLRTVGTAGTRVPLRAAKR